MPTDFSAGPRAGKDDEPRPKASGKDDEPRPKSSGKDDEPRPKSSGKGANGGGNPPNEVVEDIFRRASGLGGFLVVAFVAPIAPSPSRSEEDSPARIAFATLGSKAGIAEQEDVAQRLQQGEEALSVLEEIATVQLSAKRPVAKKKRR